MKVILKSTISSWRCRLAVAPRLLLPGLCGLLLVSGALAQEAQPVSDKQQEAQATHAKTGDVLIIIEQEQVRFTARKDVVEMQLQIFDYSGQLVYDSGAVTAPELTWVLRQGSGGAVKSGLYAYSLSLKEIGAADARVRRGHFIVDRARERDAQTDRLWVTSQNEGGVGTELTVASSEGQTIAGASTTNGQQGERDGDARDGELKSKRKRDETPNAALAGTSGRIAKFTSSTNLGNSVMTEFNGRIGIGTTPVSKLHVLSGSNDGPPRLQSSGTTGFAAGWDFYHGTTGKGYVGVPNPAADLAPGEMLVYGSAGVSTSLWAGGARALTIAPDARVSIGKTPKSGTSAMLSVVGNTEGVYGEATYTRGYGVIGKHSGPDGVGVLGISENIGLAGKFQGDVEIQGSLRVFGRVSKGGGSFKIDHPLDPANKYLSHSFVESPDMMNIYNGNVMLDRRGRAIVMLPSWFEALNREFRYQLTAVGAPANLYVAAKIKGNRFRIAGGKPGMEVSWQVTGVRQDAYSEKHRIKVEEDKSAAERGTYLHPEAFGQPAEKGVDHARHSASTPQPQGKTIKETLPVKQAATGLQ